MQCQIMRKFLEGKQRVQLQFTIRTEEGCELYHISQISVHKSQKQTIPSEMKAMSMTVVGGCYSTPVTRGGGGGGARVAINDEFAR